MEPIVHEMRETALRLEQLADAHIEAKGGHRFVDVATREKAINLLDKFQQTYPSNRALENYDIGPRFTDAQVLRVKSFQRSLTPANQDWLESSNQLAINRGFSIQIRLPSVGKLVRP